MTEDIQVIGFDADDTLWVNEPYYREAEDQFVKLVLAYGVEGDVAGALFKTEIANLELYGFGIKAFMLSLGAWAIHVPFHTTWAHEEVDEDPVSKQFFRVQRIREVLALVSH